MVQITVHANALQTNHTSTFPVEIQLLKYLIEVKRLLMKHFIEMLFQNDPFELNFSIIKFSPIPWCGISMKQGKYFNK